MNGFSALGLGVPFVGSVRLRINDVQGESCRAAMGSVGYIRNAGASIIVAVATLLLALVHCVKVSNKDA